MPHTDWFERLTGFRELPYDETRARLEVRDDRLVSRVNGRSYGIGEFTMLSAAELRAKALVRASSLRGSLRVSNVSGDVRRIARSKPRPALVLVVFDDGAPRFEVRVAYGTSQG